MDQAGAARRDVENDLVELSAAADMETPRLRMRAGRALAAGSGRYPHVDVGETVMSAPRPIRRALLAHEIGHLASGHTGAAHQRRALTVVAPIGACWAALVWLAASGQIVELDAFRAGFVATLGLWLAGMHWIGRHTKPEELEADRYAIALLGETQSTVAALDWMEVTWPPSRSERLLAPWFGTHPSNRERREAATAYDPSGAQSEVAVPGFPGPARTAGPGG